MHTPALPPLGMLPLLLPFVLAGCSVFGAHPIGSYAYVLQAERIAPSRGVALAALAALDRDLLVLDRSYDGTTTGHWTPDELATLRAGRPGRAVVAYLSIGEAETYRAYWQTAWDSNGDGTPDAGAPAFLCAENPDWRGNYPVRYWHAEWQALVRAQLVGIQAQGFDGVWLDIVDGFERFERHEEGHYEDYRRNPETGQTYREDMQQFVLHLAALARRRHPGFLVIPQNGSQLLAVAAYAQAIDALALEDLFLHGRERQPRAQWETILAALAPLRTQGKPVLVTEYPHSEEHLPYLRHVAAKHEIIILTAPRALDTAGAMIRQK